MKTKPLILLGYVRDECRYETTGEWEKPLLGGDGRPIVDVKTGRPAGPLHGEVFEPGGWLFWKRGIFSPNKTMRLVVTHLQKKSTFGFLICLRDGKFPWPTFHFWFFWKLQERKEIKNPNGLSHWEWVSGTERGIYIRTPGYRWDYDLGMIPTRGFAGGHWD